MTDDGVNTCQGCGATIYREHLDTGIAGYTGGKLLCPHCFTDSQGAGASGAVGDADEVEELSTIALIEDEKTPESESSGGSDPGSSMHAFSGDTFAAGAAAILDGAQYNRKLEPTAPTATRCRTFHSKLNEGAVAFMNDQINQWADSHPDICIKFATSTIGIFEGKKADPHIIVTVFY